MRASHDDELPPLHDLYQYDVEARAAQQIRARALSVFREHGSGRSIRLVRGRWWTRVVEPLALVASVVSYLTWAAMALASVHEAASNLPLVLLDKPSSLRVEADPEPP